jgi:Protein of unknown function (DUF3592)
MSRRSLIAILVPFAIGLLLLIGAAVTFARVAIFVRGAAETEATFVGGVARIGGSHTGSFLYPRFRFTAPDGRVITITASSGSTDQPYDDGERVVVLYDPFHPEDAELDSLLWMTPLFLVPFALLFTAIPAIIFIVMRRRQSAAIR